MMNRRFVVKTESIVLPKGVVLTRDAIEIFNMFKCHAFIEEQSNGDITQCLCLELLPLNETDELEDVLEDGMYTYHSTNPYAKKFIEILEELEDSARPITFSKDDIIATIVA